MAETKAARRKRTINRLHRLQGQLAALERAIENETDENTICEDVIVQARAIEKGMASLIVHVVNGYIEHELKAQMQHEPDQATQQIQRLMSLANQ